jgi:nitroimidazol reductase NimA-like FMN-containing flavoprotein (pyridoxamine 5'-phosphate oxidase superfamily)
MHASSVAAGSAESLRISGGLPVTLAGRKDPTMSDVFPQSAATTVRREAHRAVYDRDVVHQILDEGFVAHVGIAVDGQPFVLPMVYGRDGDRLLLHASVASRVARTLASGVRACVTVTLIEGLVIARSQFNHSVNYRSVVVLGTATPVRDLDERERLLAVLVDRVVPGRSSECRPPTRAELRETSLLTMPIEEASAKVRTGGPELTDDDDLTVPHWEGVLPLEVRVAPPEPDPRARSIPVPPSLAPWRRPGASS